MIDPKVELIALGQADPALRKRSRGLIAEIVTAIAPVMQAGKYDLHQEEYC